MYLDFRQNEKSLTLGVEIEVQLIDQHTEKLTPRAPEILEMAQNEKLAKEMFRSTLELITGVCANVQEAHKDLRQTLNQVRKFCTSMDVSLAGTGTNPVADYNNRILSASTRYHELLDRNQWLIKRMAVYGMHVHLGMHDGDACIRYNNFFLHFIPHLIALSASSPYWRGQDTGLSASRPTVYEAHPTAGLPVLVENWDEFTDLYNVLLRSKSIQSMKDIWWDIRPSPFYGTLEIRVCDGPATMLELDSIVAFIHLLAHWFEDHSVEFHQKNNLKPYHWVLRENKWRAIRYGLEAEIINHETFEIRNLSESLFYWLEKLQPYIKRFGYEPYARCIEDLIVKGNSASRQRSVMAATNDIKEVVRHNIREFQKGKPIWPSVA